jgi:hypothetical protein
MKRLSLRLTILAAALAACTGSASAQTTYCAGVLGASSTPYLSLTVPAGKTCTLPQGLGTVTVTNNVEVEKGASLILPLFPNVSVKFVVNGSLLGRDAATIQLLAIGVTANATVNIIGGVHLTGATGAVLLGRASIGGTLFVTNSTANSLVLRQNNVGGSVLVRDNKISATPIIIEDNTIGGSLVCSGNNPAPTLLGGMPNTVGGNSVGQCSGL